MAMKERIKFIDIAKAIGIYLVVLGHYVYSLNLPFEANTMWMIEHSITLFHMPLFFIISGMLFRNEELVTIWNKAKVQLLKPYVYICLICFVVGSIVAIMQGDYSWKTPIFNIIGIATGGDFFGRGMISYSGALWFCYSLALIKLIYGTLNKYNIGNIVVVLIIVIGGGYYVHR